MNCQHPDCTGIHAHGKPYSQQCPAAKQRHAERQAEYKQTYKGMRTEARYESSAKAVLRNIRYQGGQRAESYALIKATLKAMLSS
jgi:hypothetical protein